MNKLLKNFVGIDVSRSFFDAALLKADSGNCSHQQCAQTESGFKKMRHWLKQQGVCLNQETLFCMEYTGVYNSGLVRFLCQLDAPLWVEMPLRIKRAAGFERGSNDKTSAIKIAHYAYRYQDRRQVWRPVDSTLERIKHLIAQRDRIMNAMTQLLVPVKELAQCGCAAEAKQLEQLQRKPLKALQQSKAAIEQAIMNLIKEDEQLHKKIQQVPSVKGIGAITAVTLLAYTKGLRRLTMPSNGRVMLAWYRFPGPRAAASAINQRSVPMPIKS